VTRTAWGDVADLVRLLDVQADGSGRYVHPVEETPYAGRTVVEGSQLLAQSIVAAGRSYPGRRAVSAHMVFHRVAQNTAPIDFELTEHTNGRTFTALGVEVVQDGRGRASGVLLLDSTADDLIRHHASAPPVTGPDGSPAYDMGVDGREIRIVDGAYDNDPDAPVGPPTIDAWVRYNGAPADPYLNAALLVHYTGHLSVAAAMRPHAGIGQAQAHHSISTGINAITVSLHDEIPPGEWMRFHHHSTFAGSGMTHAECRVYTEDDRLLASFTVDAMVRALSGQSGDANSRL
jgi:acyl-CoA thioesterase